VAVFLLCCLAAFRQTSQASMLLTLGSVGHARTLVEVQRLCEPSALIQMLLLIGSSPSMEPMFCCVTRILVVAYTLGRWMPCTANAMQHAFMPQ
jgi:hypothetical protein